MIFHGRGSLGSCGFAKGVSGTLGEKRGVFDWLLLIIGRIGLLLAGVGILGFLV